MTASGRARPAGFYLDENLSRRIASLARARGLDVTSAQELGRHGLTDEEQLAYAAQEGRILVTRDADDFLRLASDWERAGRGHAGVLVVAWQVNTARFALLVTALERFLAERREGQMRNETGWLMRPPEA